MTCKRTLTVYFPAFFGAVYEHEETCKQPSCKILEFVRNNKKRCEGENSYIGNWKAHFVRPGFKNQIRSRELIISLEHSKWVPSYERTERNLYLLEITGQALQVLRVV